MGKIKILFYNKDVAGVNYFRTLTPATALQKDHSDKFDVEINPNVDFNDPSTVDYLKGFDIIHYHRQLHPDVNKMMSLVKELNDVGTKLVMDIDDYWFLDKTHPYYYLSMDRKLYQNILSNLKLANYVTTTTEYFAKEIKKVTGKDNVGVFFNSIDPEWMNQFKDNRKKDDKIRIMYMAGSSHRNDIKFLEGVANRLNVDSETKGKFKFIVAGWDTKGTTTEFKFNQEFGKALQERGLWNKGVAKEINNAQGNIMNISSIPQDLKEKYGPNVIDKNERELNSDESVYLYYENVLTDNHRIINDEDYLKWLDKFERGTYENEGNFARRWTQKANIYANVLDEADIVIAPLADNDFNKMKSNLKQVECWSRKLPVICSDVIPYNVDGKHMENCILIPHKPNEKKLWFKSLKKLILDEKLRKTLGKNLYKDFSKKYNLKEVTKKRAEFYMGI